MTHSELKKIVLIGASTGGPGQIEKIISSLDQMKDTSIVIGQHMAEGFIESFANRLQNHSKNKINFVEDGMELLASNIYICSGYTKIYKDVSSLKFNLTQAPNTSYNPEIDMIFNSFVPFSAEYETLCTILTGIGDDGVKGCKALSENGSRCITETQESAIVDGMTGRARKDVPNIEVFDIKGIVEKIKEFCS